MLRLKRAVRLFQDVRQVALEAGLELNPVAPRLLLPILEAASLQDDEDLHQRWVALLTNAARSDFDGEVLPYFPDILKQLTSEEARILDGAYEFLENNPGSSGESPIGMAGRLHSNVSGPVHPIILENLERLMLFTRRTVRGRVYYHYMTELGKAFVRACRFPKQAATKSKSVRKRVRKERT